MKQTEEMKQSEDFQEAVEKLNEFCGLSGICPDGRNLLQIFLQSAFIAGQVSKLREISARLEAVCIKE